MTQKSWRFGEEELRYVKEVLDSGLGASTYGTMNTRLEQAFAQRFGVRYAITHNSGTSTLHSCLAAADVGPGDKVISPALTVISNAAVTLHQNAVPVFADIDPDTFTMDPKDVERRITPRTKAIMPVHLYGLPCDMDPIMALAEKHHLTVIEDAAQCFLGQYKGRLAGTIGQMGSFSFENTKHMSTGDGGIVITNDERLAEAVRKFACMGYSMITAASGQVPHQGFCLPGPELQTARELGLAVSNAGSGRRAGDGPACPAERLRCPAPADLGPLCGRRSGLLLFQTAADAAGLRERLLDVCRPLRRGSRDWRVVARFCRQVPRPERRRRLRGLVGGLSGAGHGRTAVLRPWLPHPLPALPNQAGMEKGPLPDGRSGPAEAHAVQGQHRRSGRSPAQADALRSTIEFFGNRGEG